MKFNLLPKAIILAAALECSLFAQARVSTAINKEAGAQVGIIVTYKEGAMSESHLGRMNARGAKLHHRLNLINSGAFVVDSSMIETIAADPEVESISPDREVKATADYAVPTAGGKTANLAGYTGAGIGVAIIDSGVLDQKDFTDSKGQSRIVYSQSFLTCSLFMTNSLTGGGGTPSRTIGAQNTGPLGSALLCPSTRSSASDYYGHGTHVAGLIAGNGSNSTGSLYTYTIKGMAPSANIINLRVLDENGSGTDSSVIAAIEKAIALKDTYKIKIINMSLGRAIFESYNTDPLNLAVQKAWNAGIVVVVAAGNYGRNGYDVTAGYGTIAAPGNDPSVITVGSMKTNNTISRGDDTIATYSSKGPSLIDHVVKPDLVAPGNQLDSVSCTTCTMYTATPHNRTPYAAFSKLTGTSTTYFNLSGTSMATPMVSGAAALMLQKANSIGQSLTPDQVKARLMKTSTKSFPSSSSVYDAAANVTYVSHYDLFTVGAGYLDTVSALSSNDFAKGSAQSPIAYYDTVEKAVKIQTAANSIWGAGSTWATNVVWGDMVLNGSNVVWGDSVVWGESCQTGFNVVWGENSPWPQSANGSFATNGDN